MVDSGDEDIYKTTFKLYRNWTPESNLPLIDFTAKKNYENYFENITETWSKSSSSSIDTNFETFKHFKSIDQWKIYKSIKGLNGLFIITGILNENFRQNWFDYFHNQLPCLQNELNLKSNIELSSSTTTLSETILTKLRWITFGYHHDWNTKIYNLQQTTVCIPERIIDLCRMISMFMNFDFKPEAGIINYYGRNSSLCFHTDHSELNHQAPLISLSLGRSAIFLIGGPNKQSTKPIIPILLNDSDLIIMSDESRLALHSVPKILPESSTVNDHQSIHRINVNIRQVF